MEELLKKMKDDAGIKRLTIIRAVLQMRKNRGYWIWAYPVNAPLDEQENALFDRIYNQLKQHLIEKSKLAPDDAEKLIQYCIEPFGKKALVKFYTESPRLLGVPYLWFIAGLGLSLIAHMILNIPFLYIFLPAYFLSLLLYVISHGWIRQNKIKQLLITGIEI